MDEDFGEPEGKLLGLAGSAMYTLHAYSYLDCFRAAKGGL